MMLSVAKQQLNRYTILFQTLSTLLKESRLLPFESMGGESQWHLRNLDLSC